MINVLGTGLVYRNPRPHLEAIHAWHPSLVRTTSGDLLATFDLGQAGESLDYRTWISRSNDDGRTWSVPVHLIEDQPCDRRTTHTVRIGMVSDGTIVGLGARFYRDDPAEGLVNRENLGYVPMDLFQIRSQDEGQTWSRPINIQTPLVGPAFEMCHRIIELSDGRWLAPTSTWRGWNGEAPNGMQAIALESHDRGQTWPTYLSVVDQSAERVISWEQGLAELPDGRLVAVVWCFDEKTGTSLPNLYTISADGRTFAPPRPNGLLGETAKLLTLQDGRLLCLYRRRDQPGLWANLVQIEGDEWRNLESTCVWQGMASGMGLSGRRTSSDELGALKFGYPSLIQLPNGHVLTVFWCMEDGLHVIRWYELEVN